MTSDDDFDFLKNSRKKIPRILYSFDSEEDSFF